MTAFFRYNRPVKAEYRTIGIASVMHMGIDFLCAFSLYHHFTSFTDAFLLYNFCAFALQLPLGIVLDYLMKEKKRSFLPSYLFTVTGVLLTVLGTLIHPVVLGIGNAFFHVGGGVLSIHEDDHYHFNGRGLGTFVAPGAIGLILGTLYHDTPSYTLIFVLVSILLGLLSGLLWNERNERVFYSKPVQMKRERLAIVLLAAFLVVILRSLSGIAISFAWKQGPLLIFLSVLCLASGKTAGGFLSASFGMKKTVVFTLLISALCYLLGETLFFGLSGLFFFNMTMPLTLYLCAKVLPSYPGTAFGILTFGLFLGYLPVLYGFLRNIPPSPAGVIVSLVSLVLLYIAADLYERE